MYNLSEAKGPGKGHYRNKGHNLNKSEVWGTFFQRFLPGLAIVTWIQKMLTSQ